MNFAALHLLELSMLLPLSGAFVVALFDSPIAAARCTLGIVLAALVCSLLASVQYLAGPAAFGSAAIGPPAIGGWFDNFAIDAVAAPLLPTLALLYLITLLGTSKSNLSSLDCTRLLIAEFLSFAVMTCHSRPITIGLLAVAVVLPVWDLGSRGQRIQGFVVYMSFFVMMLALSWLSSWAGASGLAAGFLWLALLLRGGIFPLHGWMPVLIQRGSFGMATLFVLPLVEVLAAIRLILPVAPPWMLQLGCAACLATAVYCGGLAVVQQNVRRFYAHLCLSQTSLVLFAVMAATPSSLTSALCLWMSAMVSLAGLGFAIRSLEARFGELSLNRHHGYFEQVPGLAVCFFTTGLAAVGFPGTIGFIPMELLISGSLDQGLGISLTLTIVAMLNGLSIMRAYFAIFTGRRPTTSVSLQVTRIERWLIVILMLLVFLGGWFSPSVVESQHRVADDLLRSRSDQGNES